MKNRVIFALILILTVVWVFTTSPGCLNSESKSSSDSTSAAESSAESKAEVKAGDVKTEATNELKSDLSVSGVSIEGDKILQEAPYTFAEFFRDVYFDWFFRILAAIFFLMWYTGNLHPSQNFSLTDGKKEPTT